MKKTTKKEIGEAIEGAATIIEKGWTQGTSARDASGTPIRVGSPDVVRCCAIGALYRFFYLKEFTRKRLTDKSLAVLDAAIDAIEEFIPHGFNDRGLQVRISDYNDKPGRTQAEMVSLFKKAADA